MHETISRPKKNEVTDTPVSSPSKHKTHEVVVMSAAPEAGEKETSSTCPLGQATSETAISIF
jgi:hypothetical protein